jgi:hypothetical protein
MKQITIEQQQMLEDLTGLQHTRTGRVRKKQNRSYEVTKNLGLISQYHRLYLIWGVNLGPCLG